MVAGVEPDLDVRMMEAALSEAAVCLEFGDVPVGAVVARGDQILGAAGNGRERFQDPTAHAEVLALRAAAIAVGSWRLDGSSMYVTLEPCAMCAGALVLARLDRLVFGAPDPKAGFAGSLGNLVQDERLNHRVEVSGGLMEARCGDLLRSFFKERR